MFKSGFEESNTNEVELPEKSKDDVIAFLRCIYPNSLSQVSCVTALKILPLVEEYQVMHVKARCEKALLDSVDKSSKSSAGKICQLLKEACLYSLKDLRERCIHLASETSQEDLEAAYRRHPIPADAQNEILVKVNATLKAKVRVLQESNTDMAGEFKTLNDFFAGSFKHTAGFPSAGDSNWKVKDLMFLLEVDKLQNETHKRARMWDNSIIVSAKSRSVPKYSCIRRRFIDIEWLHFEISLQRDKPGASTVHFIFVLVSKKTNRENLSFRFKKDINYGNNKTINFDLQKISEICSADRGFVRDGKIGLIVKILLSKPKDC